MLRTLANGPTKRGVNREPRRQEQLPEHSDWLALRGRGNVLRAAAGHVAVHVVAGAGGTVAAPGDLIGSQASLTCDSRPQVGRWGSPTRALDSVGWRMQAVCQ